MQLCGDTPFATTLAADLHAEELTVARRIAG